MNLNTKLVVVYRQRRGCPANSASHIVLTKIYSFSASDLPRASHWNSKSQGLKPQTAR